MHPPRHAGSHLNATQPHKWRCLLRYFEVLARRRQAEAAKEADAAARLQAIERGRVARKASAEALAEAKAQASAEAEARSVGQGTPALVVHPRGGLFVTHAGGGWSKPPFVSWDALPAQSSTAMDAPVAEDTARARLMNSSPCFMCLGRPSFRIASTSTRSNSRRHVSRVTRVFPLITW